MTAPNRLRYRRLELGRGRVYRVGFRWYADYRTKAGVILGSWAETPSEAADWVRGLVPRAQWLLEES